MHPTIAEQLAAMRRRELEEAAMMPYDAYRLHQAERPKTTAEIRLADARAGRLAATIAGLVRGLAPGRLVRRRRSRITPAPTVPDQARRRQAELSEERERLMERTGAR